MSERTTLYDQLWKDFQQLDYENKRQKLINIINSLQGNVDNTEETLDLITTEGVSEEYFDNLYEIIMKTLAKDFEKRKNEHLCNIQQRFQVFVAQQEQIKKQEIEEAESLLDNMLLSDIN